MRCLPALIAVSLLAACAGRTPNPVATVQVQDPGMDCTAIQAEVASNNQRIAALGREDGEKVAQNVAAGIAGLIVPVIWFGMDFQDASGKEGTALQQRNGYLATLATKRCSVASTQ